MILKGILIWYTEKWMESTLHLVADAPANYKDQPGFEFIRAIPTVWDDSGGFSARITKTK